ncbi:cytochrome P450 [Kitasatospora brasiliensis]|uniref:cytochrome P450 n=1 Tax=Kitasatospora brasiliensis TaxID=3058040 RepID=UPI00292F79EC|nr:cytochrome P450 [Kitasatospora sp. K002]
MNEIFDPAVYDSGIPYEAYERLRAEQPVSWHEEPALHGLPGGPGFWAVMRHADVQYVSRTPEVFSATLGATQLLDPAPGDLGFLRAMLLNMDPPTHNPLRRTISHLFTPRRLAELEPLIAATTVRLVEEAKERGTFDLVQDVTDRLALTTLAEVMGVPESDQRLFFEWANRIIGYQDDEYRLLGAVDGIDNPRSPDALQDMHDYASELREYRLRHPGPDVISALVHAEVDGRRISDEEFKNMFFLFAVAGNDTTRSALPGGIQALLDHPDQLDLLKREPQRWGGAIEECLRYAPPVIHFRRTATRRTELGGAVIQAGDKVVVFYPAANRDPSVFENPDVFDITRKPNRHVSFGHGPHVCVAAGLARMQLKHMFTAVAERLPGLRLDGPVERLRSNFVAAVKRMPVTGDWVEAA